MEVTCTKCLITYQFSNKWKGNPQNYICRYCKIRATTKNKQFKLAQSEKSKIVLSEPNTRSRMSQRAILNNINNAEKISKSLKNYYNNNKLRQIISNRTKEHWKNKKYSQKVRNGLIKRWNDPVYRGKVLGSRSRLKKQQVSIIKHLKTLNFKYTTNYILGFYTFDFKIKDNILYDEILSDEKQLFLSHYFPNFIYTSDLAEVEKLES